MADNVSQLNGRKSTFFQRLRWNYWRFFFWLDNIIIGPKETRAYYKLDLKDGEKVQNVKVASFITDTLSPFIMFALIEAFFVLTLSIGVGLIVGIADHPTIFLKWLFELIYETTFPFSWSASLTTGAICLVIILGTWPIQFILMEWQRLHSWIITTNLRAWVLPFNVLLRQPAFSSNAIVLLEEIKWMTPYHGKFFLQAAYGGWILERLFHIVTIILPSRAGSIAMDVLRNIDLGHAYVRLIEKLKTMHDTHKDQKGAYFLTAEKMDAVAIALSAAARGNPLLTGDPTEVAQTGDAEAIRQHWKAMHPKTGCGFIVMWDQAYLMGPYGNEPGELFSLWAFEPDLAPLDPEPPQPIPYVLREGAV